MNKSGSISTLFGFFIALTVLTVSASAHAQIVVGSRVEVDSLPMQTANVRSAPSGNIAGNPIGSQSHGRVGTVTGGPRTASVDGNSYTWWNVNFDSGQDGWVAHVALKLVQSNVQLPNLVVSSLTVSPTTGQAGTSVTVNLTVRNEGPAAAPSGTVTRIRFANSSTLYPSDTLLDEFTVGSLSANGGQRSYSKVVTIPSGASAGLRYIGATANATNDVTSESNTSDNQRTVPFTVITAAQYSDLIVQNVTVTPTSGPATSSVQVYFNVRNNGSGTSLATTANIRLSASPTTPSTSDFLLGSVDINALSSGGQQQFSPRFSIPNGISTGQRYVWIIVDPNNNANQGSNTNNDRISSPFSVTQTTAQLPNLVVSALSINPVSAQSGSSVIVNLTVRNDGPGAAPSGTVTRIRLSSSTTIDPNDLILDQFTASAMSANGGQQSFTRTVTIPAGTSPGSFYIGATANATNNVTSETNESDNQRTTMFTVTSPTQPEAPAGGFAYDGFDYPIGNRGYNSGTTVSILEFPDGISTNGSGTESANLLYSGNGIEKPRRENNNGTNSSWWLSQDIGAFYASWGIHSGEDWNRGSGDDDVGEIVYAAASGTVIEIRGSSEESFHTLVLRHVLEDGQTVYTIYGHVSPLMYSGSENTFGKFGTKSDFAMHEGFTQVYRGQPIARIGNLPTGPHLHFEIRSNTNDFASKPYFISTGAIQSQNSARSSMNSEQVFAAYTHMRAAGLVDPSDFIDARRPSSANPGLGGGGDTSTSLVNGVSVSGTTNSTTRGNDYREYSVILPPNASRLTITTSAPNSSIDVDLYVKRGVAPTFTSYECRPYAPGSDETCEFQNPQGGTWFARVYGYNTGIQNFSIKATWISSTTVGTPTVTVLTPSSNVSVPNTTTAYTFFGSATAPGSVVSAVEWRLNGGPWNTVSDLSWSYTVTGLSVGENVIELRSRNSQNSYSGVVARVITRAQADGSLLGGTPPLGTPSAAVTRTVSLVFNRNPSGISAIATDNSFSQARFWLGATQNQGESLQEYFGGTNEIIVAGAMAVRPSDIGQAGEIFVVIRSIVGNSERWSYLRTDRSAVPWDSQVDTIEPAFLVNSLQSVQIFDVLAGRFVTGDHQIFIGYSRRNGGPLHYTSQPLQLYIF